MPSTLKKLNTLTLMLALLAPALLYGQCLGFYFVYDDSELIVSKLPPADFAAWIKIALSPYYHGLPYYRPLPGILFALERTFYQLKPEYYHLTNLILCSLLSASLYRMLRLPLFNLTQLPALCLTLLCISHPITSSTVYMISGREALLAALFLTLTISLTLESGFGLLAGISLFLALVSRESSVFILPVLGLILLGKSRALRESLQEIVVFLASLGFYAILRYLALSAGNSSPELTEDWRQIPLSFLYALSAILSPTINLHYEPELLEWLTGERMGLLLLLVVGVNIIMRQSRALSNRPVTMALIFSFLSFLPTANIFAQETPFDERHLLTPMISLICALFLAGKHLLDSGPMSARPVAIKVSLSILISSLMAISFLRGDSFRSDDAFFDNWIRFAPDRSKVINHLAAKALTAGDFQGALTLCNRSINLRGSTPGYLYRGRIHRLLGDLPAARLDLEATLKIAADQSAAWCDLGLLDLKEGSISAAQEHFGKAQKYEPNTWCTPLNSGADTPNHWEKQLTLSAEALAVLPISSREDLRNYAEGQRIRSDYPSKHL